MKISYFLFFTLLTSCLYTITTTNTTKITKTKNSTKIKEKLSMEKLTEKKKTQIENEWVTDEPSDIVTQLCGLISSVLFLIGTIMMLYYNQLQRQVKKSLLSTLKTETIEIDPERVEDSNQEKIVHFTGIITTAGILEDMDLTIKFPNTIFVKRFVEMYQILNGGAHSGSNCGWESDFILSKDNKNPFEKFCITTQEYNFGTKVGQISLPKESWTLIYNTERLNFMPDHQFQNRELKFSQELEEVLEAYHNSSVRRIEGRYIYISKFEDEPSIGDLRIHYKYLPEVQALIIGRQLHHDIIPFSIQKNQESGYLNLEPEAIGPNFSFYYEEEDMSNNSMLEPLAIQRQEGYKLTFWNVLVLPFSIIRIVGQPKKAFFELLVDERDKDRFVGRLAEQSLRSYLYFQILFVCLNSIFCYTISSFFVYQLYQSDNERVKEHFYKILGVSVGLVCFCSYIVSKIFVWGKEHKICAIFCTFVIGMVPIIFWSLL